jgi:hypothetical protein
MTDRELLELAAKASGLPLEDGAFGLLDWWNPLTDDGDALRLAVNMNLLEKHAFIDALHEENERCNGDYYSATRRAIVRAAAEIGRAMQ